MLGVNDFDFEAFGDDIPDGARFYRTVLLDAYGFETLSFYNATDLAFANRLHASEVREERFTLDIPQKLSGPVTLKAVATYLRYPPAFSNGLNQEESPPVRIAQDGATIGTSNSG